MEGVLTIAQQKIQSTQPDTRPQQMDWLHVSIHAERLGWAPKKGGHCNRGDDSCKMIHHPRDTLSGTVSCRTTDK